MINCEWIRKQKKERPSLGSSPGPKCKPNVRLRVRCANTEQPCFSALCDAWLLRKRDEIRESSYIKYRAILERHIKPRLGSRRLGGICTASVDAFTRELLETDGLSVKTVHDILSVLHSVLKDTEARRPAGALAVQIRYPKGKRREMRVLTIEEQKRLVAYTASSSSMHASAWSAALPTCGRADTSAFRRALRSCTSSARPSATARAGRWSCSPSSSSRCPTTQRSIHSTRSSARSNIVVCCGRSTHREFQTHNIRR